MQIGNLCVNGCVAGTIAVQLVQQLFQQQNMSFVFAHSNWSLRPSSQMKSVRQDADGPTTASETDAENQFQNLCVLQLQNFTNSSHSDHSCKTSSKMMHGDPNACSCIRAVYLTREKPQPWKVSLHPSCNRYVPQMDMTLPSDLCRICLEHVLGNCEP